MAKKLLVIHLGDAFYKRQKNQKLNADRKDRSKGFQESFPHQFFSALLLLHRHDFTLLLVAPSSMGGKADAVGIKPALSVGFSSVLSEFLAVEKLPLFLFFTALSEAHVLHNALKTKQQEQLADEIQTLKAFAFDTGVNYGDVSFAFATNLDQKVGQKVGDKNGVETRNAIFENMVAKSSKILLRRFALIDRESMIDAAEIRHDSWLSLAETLACEARIAVVRRNTNETKVTITLNLDGSGVADIHTGLNFYDHMLDNFTKHAGIDLTLHVDGDLEVDEHHTIEDTAIALGTAFDKALGNKRGIARYGFDLPMDETAASCVLDLGGRAYLKYDITLKRERVGDFPTEMLKHFYDSFAKAGRFNLHIASKGDNDHHIIEASFKAMARSFRMALQKQGTAMPSTKGAL